MPKIKAAKYLILQDTSRIIVECSGFCEKVSGIKVCSLHAAVVHNVPRTQQHQTPEADDDGVGVVEADHWATSSWGCVVRCAACVVPMLRAEKTYILGPSSVGRWPSPSQDV